MRVAEGEVHGSEVSEREVLSGFGHDYMSFSFSEQSFRALPRFARSANNVQIDLQGLDVGRAGNPSRPPSRQYPHD